MTDGRRPRRRIFERGAAEYREADRVVRIVAVAVPVEAIAIEELGHVDEHRRQALTHLRHVEANAELPLTHVDRRFDVGRRFRTMRRRTDGADARADRDAAIPRNDHGDMVTETRQRLRQRVEHLGEAAARRKRAQGRYAEPSESVDPRSLPTPSTPATIFTEVET